jgi:hypothetical protein
MHDEHVERTIEMVQVQVRDLEVELTEKKRIVNSLCKLIGREPLFSNVEPSHVGTVLRTDEFYGKALTSVARTVLERRDAAGLGAASVDALYSDLVRGGFQFDAKNDSTAKRSLAISLAKNSYLFHRLPNADWGLVSWYEKLPTKSNKAHGNKDEKDHKDNPIDKEIDGLAEPYPNDFAKEVKILVSDEEKETREAMRIIGEMDPTGVRETTETLREITKGMKAGKGKK